MAVCTLAIPPDTEQVRVARLVATAAARRTGLPESWIDDVRLAVGEAVGRAVVRQQRAGTLSPVHVRLIDEDAGFAIEVADTAAGIGADDSTLALDLITGLVPSVHLVDQAGAGQVIRMEWSGDEATQDR
ncbi:MAG: ATP-binding protein [Candidatus Nanopelagicales bacterium]|jgi:serine/threonine-protein kinase RsbW|nr:ATP-binding protein [Actinomycetota bacterium]HNL51555.1 ATP-binding protein [Actinomycetota bacterium]HNO15876.1 ATP-binding protein [Actinomycetota bacterium]HUM86313.1 ATP-binding protein [Actinomycetota bacterium]